MELLSFFSGPDRVVHRMDRLRHCKDVTVSESVVDNKKILNLETFDDLKITVRDCHLKRLLVPLICLKAQFCFSLTFSISCSKYC